MWAADNHMADTRIAAVVDKYMDMEAVYGSTSAYIFWAKTMPF
jgi:hypothetical protein